MTIPSPLRRSIGLMQATVLLVASLGVGLTLSAVQLNIAAGEHRETVRVRVEEVLTLAEGGAARAAWTLDPGLARRVLDGILSTGGFRGARLMDERGMALASVKRHSADAHTSREWLQERLLGDATFGTRKLELTIAGRKQEVGSLTVEKDPQTVIAAFIRQAQDTVLASLVQALLVGLLLLWLSERLVTSHLHRAAGQLIGADPDHGHDVKVTIAPVHRDNELGLLLASTNEMIARLQESRRELSHVASHDPLTGLANRVLIRNQLRGAVQRASRSGTRVAVLFLDLDRFKSVNDLYGHECGDALLVEIAAALATAVRESDSIGRLSGDEFLIVGEGMGGEAEAVQLVQRVVQATARPFDLAGHEVTVDVSVGVAVYPADGDDPDALIHHADLAMYRAKRDSGSTWQFYSTEMSERASARLRMEAALSKARERGELELHYQPRFDTATGALVGCEALVRWRREGRLVNAAEFVCVAENSGLILDIGDFVLDEACRQAAAWCDAGAPLRMAVNVSGRQLKEGDLAADVRAALERHDLPAELLELEVTESVLIENLERSRTVLTGLREAGVCISIDDFGTGYSSLAYLIELPASCLKIDRSFVSGSNTSQVVLDMIISMARALGMRSVAEGVETDAQHAMLSEKGCDEMQGYLLGKPVSGPDFARTQLADVTRRTANGALQR